jgi:hypothetical protein
MIRTMLLRPTSPGTIFEPKFSIALLELREDSDGRFRLQGRECPGLSTKVLVRDAQLFFAFRKETSRLTNAFFGDVGAHKALIEFEERGRRLLP